MKRDTEIKLIGTTPGENAIGDAITTPTERPVLATKKSVRQSEFYQAQATGLRPELTFVIWTREYQDEPELEYKGKQYNIIRTFEPNDEEIELICQGIVNKTPTDDESEV